jgi:hypothetical protein
VREACFAISAMRGLGEGRVAWVGAGAAIVGGAAIAFSACRGEAPAPKPLVDGNYHALVVG